MAIIADLDTAQAAVKVASAAVSTLRDTEFLRFPDTDLMVLARDLEHLSHLVYTTQIHLVGDLDNRGAAGTHGCTSTAAMIRDALAISPGDAKARVNAAKAILPRETSTGAALAPTLPVLRAAVHDGLLGVDQIRIIETTMRKLPTHLDPVTRESCEHTLVEHGQLLEPKRFAVFARGILLICDPDGDLDKDPTDRVELTISTRNPDTGMTRITGQLDDEGVEILTQAIDAASTPHPSNGEPDLRSPAHRRGLALTEALRRSLDRGDGPTQGGERPHITLTMDFEDLKRRIGYATLDHGGPVSAVQARRLACDAQIIPVVLGSDSQVLDVGRASRTFPTAIRRAITIRDKGCTFPGVRREALVDHVEVRDLRRSAVAAGL